MKPSPKCNKRANYIRDRFYAGEIRRESALVSLRALVGEYRPAPPYEHTRAEIDLSADALARAFLAPDAREY